MSCWETRRLWLRQRALGAGEPRRRCSVEAGVDGGRAQRCSQHGLLDKTLSKESSGRSLSFIHKGGGRSLNLIHRGGGRSLSFIH